MHNDFRGLRDTVIDHITAGRHIGAGAPLELICALSRNRGNCNVHGKVVDWNQHTKPGSAASPEDIEAAENLRRGNCFSCTGVRSPLSAPATEPLGVQILCLQLMFACFWVFASEGKIICNHCKNSRYIVLDCPERQCFKYRAWGH